MSYTLDEDAYADAEFQDVVRKRFVRGWDALLEGYRVRRRSSPSLLLEARALEADLAAPSSLPAARPSQTAFTDDNYRDFFAMCVDVLVRPWEKLIMGMKVTEVRRPLPPCLALSFPPAA